MAARTIKTYCGVCEHSCGMQVSVENNRVTGITGLKEQPLSKGILCPKGLAAAEILSSPDRLKAPLRRSKSGWRKISWDDALDLCAERLLAIKERYGPEGLLVYHGQSYLKLRLTYFIMKRFTNLYGTVNLCSAGSECFISTLLAHFATYGNLPFADYGRSRCIVIWGSNPCASGGIGKSPPHMKHLLQQRKADGARIIVIDPRRTETAGLADRHLQPRPGTDGALALGMLRAIVDEGLEDRAYIEKHTSGFDRLAEMLQEYPLEKVSGITGIAAEEIAEAARLFASARPASVSAHSGLEHHTNGVQAIRAVNLLLAVTGNVDVPGGNTFLGQVMFAPAEVAFGEHPPALGAEAHPMFVSMISQAQAVAALELMDRDEPYPVRGMLVAGGSPLSVLAGAGKAARIMERMEFSAVIDLFMTETAARADVVLPAAMFLERDELNNSPLMLQRKCVEPDGPRPDWQIWWELARRCGYAEHFPWKTADQVMEHMLEATDFSLDRVRQAECGIVVEPPVGKMLKEGFYTLSGKIELYSSSMESNGYDPLPRYLEPAESPASAPQTAAKYPLVLTTGGRYPVFVHSQHRMIESLRRHFPEPIMTLHPDTAAGYGVADGDLAAVESLRGRIEIRAALDDGILPGVVHLPHGWSEANCNLLTDDLARDPVSGFPGLKSSLCRIEKM